jgi:DNA polymerase elongation subunit (family B)
MLNMGMYPTSMGPHFLTAYRNILIERLAAKDAGLKVKDAILKICLNGTFGKTSSKYSTLYNPSMTIHTTLTGQLCILMLIEALEANGVPVVSANTDGIVVKALRSQEALQRTIVREWEKTVNLETEETDYSSIHSRDVNSYIAIKTDGKVKTKGAFAKAGLAKNPQSEICVTAAGPRRTENLWAKWSAGTTPTG